MNESIENALHVVIDRAATEKGKEQIEKVLSTHEQEIVDIVLEIKQNGFIKKITEQRDKFSPKDKLNLYEKGSQSVWATIKRSSGISLLTRNLFSFLPNKDKLRKDMFDNFTPLVRIFVHLGIFSRPEGLDDDQVHKNIEDDKKGLENQLLIAQAACTVVPQLRPGLPIIQRIKPLAKVGVAGQERILHAVNNAMEHDQVVAGAKSRLYRNVSTDAVELGTNVETGKLSDELRQAA